MLTVLCQCCKYYIVIEVVKIWKSYMRTAGWRIIIAIIDTTFGVGKRKPEKKKACTGFEPLTSANAALVSQSSRVGISCKPEFFFSLIFSQLQKLRLFVMIFFHITLLLLLKSEQSVVVVVVILYHFCSKPIFEAC